MEVGITLIAIAVILVVVVYYGGQIENFINSTSSAYLQQYTNGIIKTVPKSGQTTCTLDVAFTPTYPPTGFTNQQITISGGASKISWIACSGGIIPAELIPQFNMFSVVGAGNLLNIGQVTTNIKFNAVLIADDGTELFAIGNPKTVSVSSNLINPFNTPSFNMDFTFLSVPRQHYVLQLTSPDVGINSGNVGTSYSQQISP